MILYTTNTREKANSFIFPNRIEANIEEEFREAMQYDHVTAQYENNHRANANFLESNVIVMDLDNDHSNDASSWIDMEDVKLVFQGVKMALVTSRNHWKQKENQSARPRFHVYFPIHSIHDAKEYRKTKEAILNFFPYFDTNAMDSARLIFGVENPIVEIVKGDQYVTDILTDSFETWDSEQGQILEGGRNNAMSQYAGRILIRLGDTDESRELFNQKSTLCSPPLSDEELEKIWQSALRFGRRISESPDYIPPEQFKPNSTLKPSDYSDVGQATVLAGEYQRKLRYSPATDYLIYNGSYWEESKPKSLGLAQELTFRQLEEAEQQILEFSGQLEQNGGLAIIESVGEKKATEVFSKPQRIAYKNLQVAIAYQKYAIKRRDDRGINASLRQAQSMLEISSADLDTNEFLLNTPSQTLNLKTGEVFEHLPENFITKQTTVDANKENLKLWLDALDTFFLDDKDLINYVQQIVGLSIIGKVYVESLIIAYGDGRNGKSTFWNTISRILGNYSGNLSADVLTVNNRRNVKPELAESKGKRLLISAELQEGMRLNTSIVKQLCSTDEIFAEKKYKSPFSFIPSHTLVLYTNHLPKVGAIDSGTWRRLIVIPFEAKIEGRSDVKNYADYLYHEAGGAILSWMIEGAQKVIASDFKIPLPQKVREAIEEYRESNDWMGQFLNDCCELDNAFVEKSGQVYDEYRAFCFRTGEFTRSSTDFYAALASEGFVRRRRSDGNYIQGLKLNSEFS
ncbi:phage/plasmid primase, P4 family [Fundicoccus ignavus]|uniref:DNA primase n=1 Tax=Fundicoccus ignavus TaxID=2664442 RepID=A0A844BYH0_9LACT|nr:phage/plasmid primase, P4 family [Fundicoccus ignavus]MRJ47098.1 DNA primase [Fundicoccus ignavus]